MGAGLGSGKFLSGNEPPNGSDHHCFCCPWRLDSGNPRRNDEVESELNDYAAQWPVSNW